MEIGPTAPLAVLGPLGLRRGDGVSAIDHIALDGGPIGAGECDISGVGMVGEEAPTALGQTGPRPASGHGQYREADRGM